MRTVLELRASSRAAACRTGRPHTQHFHPPDIHSESKHAINERLLPNTEGQGADSRARPTFLQGSIAALSSYRTVSSASTLASSAKNEAREQRAVVRRDHPLHPVFPPSSRRWTQWAAFISHEGANRQAFLRHRSDFKTLPDVKLLLRNLLAAR